MASAANPFASLINKSAPVVGASGATNPFLQPVDPDVLASDDVGSDTSSDGSWTDEPSFSHLFKPLPTRSRRRARPISIVKRSLTRKRINNPSSRVGMQCMRGQDGKYYYIPIDPYNPAHLEIINGLSPLLVNPTPRELKQGALYTYILASIITKDAGTGADIELVPLKLYACQAQNIFEFGTKHHHIFFRMALTNELASVAQANGIDENKVEYGLYASGEIKCITPIKLMVNFFSGTYRMKRKIKIPKIPKHRMGIPYEIDDMTKLMRRIHPNYKIKYNPAPFITSESVPITQNQLDFLESKGIPCFRFDTENQCREMRMHVMRIKNMEKRIVGLEEMHQKYQQIMNPPPAPPAPPPTNAFIMTSGELKEYAERHELSVPEPPYDPDTKKAVRQIVQAHIDANKGAGGGKIRTIKRKRTPKKRTLKKRV
jgi:hypothetical protein